jgi:putative ATPase
VAVAAAHAVEHVGMPECQLNLAQAAVYLALAPKSNASYKGLRAAQEWIREHGAPEIPAHLRDAHYPGAKKLGRGEGYDYPHDRPEGVSEQRVIPDDAAGERFLELTDRGDEKALQERLEEIRAKRSG